MVISTYVSAVIPPQWANAPCFVGPVDAVWMSSGGFAQPIVVPDSGGDF